MDAMAEDLVVLREILQRELETINAYEKMIERVADPQLRQIIEHVTDEEREHVSEMYQLIMERDERQRERARLSEEQLHAMHLTTAAAPAAASSATATAATPEMREVLAAPTAARAAGLPDSLLVPATPSPADDPFPPPPPIFPDGAWSVGGMKGSPQQGSGVAGS